MDERSIFNWPKVVDDKADFKEFTFDVMFLGFSAANLQYCGYDGIERSPSFYCYLPVWGSFVKFGENQIKISKQNGCETRQSPSFPQNQA